VPYLVLASITILPETLSSPTASGKESLYLAPPFSQFFQQVQIFLTFFVIVNVALTKYARGFVHGKAPALGLRERTGAYPGGEYMKVVPLG
jgi:hypothetical protein